mgnify:CR=1 FL=1
MGEFIIPSGSININGKNFNEAEPLKVGTAFYLVKNLLELNKLVEIPMVEVVLMSKNSPETGVRMLNSIAHYKLDITRIALTGGEPLAPYMDAFGIDLFLSKDAADVQRIIDNGKCAAALWCEGAARSGAIQRSAAVGLF